MVGRKLSMHYSCMCGYLVVGDIVGRVFQHVCTWSGKTYPADIVGKVRNHSQWARQEKKYRRYFLADSAGGKYESDTRLKLGFTFGIEMLVFVVVSYMKRAF